MTISKHSIVTPLLLLVCLLASTNIIQGSHIPPGGICTFHDECTGHENGYYYCDCPNGYNVTGITCLADEKGTCVPTVGAGAPCAVNATCGYGTTFCDMNATDPTNATLGTCAARDWWCFSGRSTVQVQDARGSVTMEELRVGDFVRVAGGSFSRVYSFGHYQPNVVAEYLQIQTAPGAVIQKNFQPIEISSEHLLYVFNMTTKGYDLLPAGHVKIGDHLFVSEQHVLAPSRVTAINKVHRRGAYSPLTATGNILVGGGGGVLASNYVSRSWLKDRVSGQMLHMLQHGAALPYRLYCTAIGCENETYDEATGFSPWVLFWFNVEQWQLSLHPALQALFLMFLAIPATLVVIAGALLAIADSTGTTATHVLACVLGYCVWKKQQKRRIESGGNPKGGQ